MDLGPVVKWIPAAPYEQEKLKELSLEPHKVDSSNYPDHESQYKREFAAERDMLRIFYVAAARGML
jgi:hypothetical protein